MPIYEYECKDCSHLFDALQKMSDDPLTDCPDCGNPSLRKLLSAPNFRLKGGGWYETDFKDKNKRNLAGEAGKSTDTKTADKKTDAKTDSKQADAGKSSSKSKPAADSGD
jgi:putative FmdB family regulatory protein